MGCSNGKVKKYILNVSSGEYDMSNCNFCHDVHPEN